MGVVKKGKSFKIYNRPPYELYPPGNNIKKTIKMRMPIPNFHFFQKKEDLLCSKPKSFQKKRKPESTFLYTNIPFCAHPRNGTFVLKFYRKFQN